MTDAGDLGTVLYIADETSECEDREVSCGEVNEVTVPDVSFVVLSAAQSISLQGLGCQRRVSRVGLEAYPPPLSGVGCSDGREAQGLEDSRRPIFSSMLLDLTEQEVRDGVAFGDDGPAGLCRPR